MESVRIHANGSNGIDHEAPLIRTQSVDDLAVGRRYCLTRTESGHFPFLFDPGGRLIPSATQTVSRTSFASPAEIDRAASLRNLSVGWEQKHQRPPDPLTPIEFIVLAALQLFPFAVAQAGAFQF